MKLLKTKQYLKDRELKELMERQKSISNFRDFQIIYAIQTNKGKTADEIAAILGITKRKVYWTIQRYNKYGIGWKEDKRRGGRRKGNEYMTKLEEEGFLNALSIKAINGEILTYKDVKNVVERKLGHKVSDDYIWVLFKRHGWRKKAPRPRHPLANITEQESFKKNLKRYWHPN